MIFGSTQKIGYFKKKKKIQKSELDIPPRGSVSANKFFPADTVSANKVKHNMSSYRVMYEASR